MADHDGASCAERDLELLQSTRQAVVHDMIQRCRRLAGGALACLVLLVLHLIHGSTLLLALFLHLINHIRLSTSTSTLTRPGGNTSDTNSNPSTKALSDDITIWKNKKKIPSCLGVIFVPSARGYFSFKKFRYTAWSEDVVFQGMMEDVIKIVSWSRRLEIDSLLLYDENGEGSLRDIWIDLFPVFAESLHATSDQTRSCQITKQAYSNSITDMLKTNYEAVLRLA